MTDPTKAIKDALEAGPTPGPWEARCRDVSYMGGDWGRVKFLQWEVYGPEEPPGRGAFFQADAQLIAACNPTAISSLLSRLEDAERDALTGALCVDAQNTVVLAEQPSQVAPLAQAQWLAISAQRAMDESDAVAQ